MKKHHFLKTIFQLIFFCALGVLTLSGCKTSASLVKENNPVVLPQNLEENWQNALKSSFRQHYSTVVNTHAEKMHASYPVIAQDLLNMTLIRSNGEKVRFVMDKEVYLTFAHTSHTPLTIYSILYPSDFEVDNDSTLLKLANYSLLLQDAEKGIKEVEHISEGQKQRILSLLTESNQYVQKIIKDRKTSKEEYHEFAKSVRELVKANLKDGAMEQLTQFLEKLENWKIEFPDENWNELRVVVLGFHQPRDMYALKLFFQWLLEEPAVEKRVVYAEFQFSIFGANREKAEELALELLTKVDLEKEPSLFLLGEETLLQKDVMGPATEKILAGWGESNWFLKED